MKQTIYLVASSRGVLRMTKSLPSLGRGEVPIKVDVTIEQGAFRTPVISKEIYIDDWREGIDINDVEFKQSVITPKEAEMIRESRMEKMKEILEAQGYMVAKPEAEKQ